MFIFSLSRRFADTVVEGCSSSLYLGGLQILWWKGVQVLSAGESLISVDKRLSLMITPSSNRLAIKVRAHVNGKTVLRFGIFVKRGKQDSITMGNFNRLVRNNYL